MILSTPDKQIEIREAWLERTVVNTLRQTSQMASSQFLAQLGLVQHEERSYSRLPARFLNHLLYTHHPALLLIWKANERTLAVWSCSLMRI